MVPKPQVDVPYEADDVIRGAPAIAYANPAGLTLKPAVKPLEFQPATQNLADMAAQSNAQQAALELADTGSFDDFVQAYLASNLCPQR